MILSICIPTFNRKDRLNTTLEFFKNEIADCDDVELIVSDNCSSDGTSHLLREKSFLKYNVNSTNVGIRGNLQILYSLSCGEYVWFVGDDDILVPGVVQAILRRIKNSPDYIFVNHCIVNGEKVQVQNVLESYKIKCPQDFMATMLGRNFGQLMFLTASIHQRKLLNDVIYKANNLACPILYSLNSIKNCNIEFVTEIMIYNQIGEISWRDEAILVFGRYIPTNILAACRNGLSFTATSVIFRNWLVCYWRQAVFCITPKHVRKLLLKIL